MGARLKCSSCESASGLTSGNSFLSSNLNQYFNQRQRLQVDNPKVKSEGAIVSRAGVSGLRIYVFSLMQPTSTLHNTIDFMRKPRFYRRTGACPSTSHGELKDMRAISSHFLGCDEYELTLRWRGGALLHHRLAQRWRHNQQVPREFRRHKL